MTPASGLAKQCISSREKQIKPTACINFDYHLLNDVGYTNDIFEMVDSMTLTCDKMVEIAKGLRVFYTDR